MDRRMTFLPICLLLVAVLVSLDGARPPEAVGNAATADDLVALGKRIYDDGVTASGAPLRGMSLGDASFFGRRAGRRAAGSN